MMRWVFSMAVLCTASVLCAQPDPRLPEITTRTTELGFDSGYRTSKAPGEVLARFDVAAPDSAWVRLYFGACQFSGSRAEGGSYLRLTSLLDGGTQVLDADAFAQWGGTSAYFNGSDVSVELIGGQGAGSSRLVIDHVVAAPSGSISSRSICGSADDRVASQEPANGRLLPAGCTAWIFSDLNHSMLTAGHCGVSAGTVIEFNVPASNADGTLVHPQPQFQFAADASSVQTSVGGVGNDWCYFGVFPNADTGLTAYQTQGASYTLDSEAPPVDGQFVRITGFGTVSLPLPRAWNQTQRTASGNYLALADTTLQYDADTTGGNSGSPVYLLESRTVVGIHTNAGCDAGGGANSGTAVQNPGLQAALASPRGVCASGTGAVWGTLFVVGDLSNNLGAVDAESANFGQLSQVGPAMQGLAYDWQHDRLLAIDLARNLYEMNPDSGAALMLGPLVAQGSPITETIGGLGFDPWTGKLYGIAQASGQLYGIDPLTRVTRRIGAPSGPGVGGLDFDSEHRRLVGIEAGGGSPKLVSLDTQTGERAAIGGLGVSPGTFAGLAYNSDDGALYSIAAPSGDLYRIDAMTGAATLVGRTGGAFGSGFGLAARSTPPLCAALDFNRDGVADQGDVDALIQAISSGQWTVSPDVNRDGVADQTDVNAVIGAIAGTCE